MMDMHARNQYLYTLITNNGGYHLKAKKEKSRILTEYCRITGQHRSAVSRKIRTGSYIRATRKEVGVEQRRRATRYDRQIVALLIRLWEIFDRPCGQRLAPMIQRELDRLRRFGELTITDALAQTLLAISARTIDTKLAPHKQKEWLKRRYSPRVHPLLYEKIPVKLSADQGRGIGQTIQIDLVEHCGQSAEGTFLSTRSVTDVGSGWWEGETVMGKSAWGIAQALGRIQHRFPFPWEEIHSDNGSEFINDLVFRYAKRNNLHFSRSRPYMKNDNCFVEQKNGTHVRRVIGHHRHDTRAEEAVIRSLYREELRLFKNFFQPIIPLLSKERIGGHLRRRYGIAKTPYERIMEAPTIAQSSKGKLLAQYASLNPAELKRKMTAHQDALLSVYRRKEHQRQEAAVRMVERTTTLAPRFASFFLAEPMHVQQHSLIA